MRSIYFEYVNFTLVAVVHIQSCRYSTLTSVLRFGR